MPTPSSSGTRTRPYDSGQIKAGTYQVTETPGDVLHLERAVGGLPGSGGNAVSYGANGAVAIGLGRDRPARSQTRRSRG